MAEYSLRDCASQWITQKQNILLAEGGHFLLWPGPDLQFAAIRYAHPLATVGLFATSSLGPLERVSLESESVWRHLWISAENTGVCKHKLFVIFGHIYGPHFG